MSKYENQENLAPNIVRRVYNEYKQILKEPIEGIEVTINEQNASQLLATIDGPQGTPFAKGTFDIRICLTKDFPSQPPKGYFLTKIFHPNVGPNGEICVNTLKQDWNSKMGIKNVLLTIRCLLIQPNPESALNEEAGKLLLEDYSSYEKRALIMTDIHAKRRVLDEPSTSSSASTAAAAAAGGDGKISKTKDAVSKLAEKKKRNKKRGLKRL